MIDLALAQSEASDTVRVGEALMARFTTSPSPPVVARSIQDWVRILTSRLTMGQACSVAAHLFGVLPLIDAFVDRGDSRLAAVRSGATLGALGLFTPSPEEGWGGAIVGEFSGQALRVSGDVRVASSAAEGSIVLVQVGAADQRLAWLDHHARGVELRATRDGGPPRNQAPRWLAVDGATIAVAHVSRPVTLVPGAELYEWLERYVAVWSLFALEYTRATLRSLRRTARAGRRGHAVPFSASQVMMMDLGELEIETELVAIAAARCPAEAALHPAGLVLALAAARALAHVAAKASELRDHLGLALDGPLTDDGAAAWLAAHVGGAPTLTNELARTLDSGRASSGGTR